MKKLISFLAFAFIIVFANNLIAQTTNKDVVYLKNGSIIKGIIIEQNINVNLKLKTSDGSLFVFDMKDIEKITKERVGENKKDIASESNINDPNYINTTAKLYREPAVSTLLSFLIPGLGQYYNGQSGKGTGHLLWYLGSYAIMYVSISNMYEKDYYGEYVLKVGSDSWQVLALASSFSVIGCWIASMIDANHSSKAINRQLGLASFQLGDKATLSFNPDFKYVNNNSLMNSKGITPVYGLNMRLSF